MTSGSLSTSFGVIRVIRICFPDELRKGRRSSLKVHLPLFFKQMPYFRCVTLIATLTSPDLFGLIFVNLRPVSLA